MQQNNKQTTIQANTFKTDVPSTTFIYNAPFIDSVVKL